MTQSQSQSTEPLVFTVEETSKLLRMGLNQTYAAIRRGEIPSYSVGRRILVPRQKLLAMLNCGGSDATK